MAYHPRRRKTGDELLDEQVAWFRSMQKAHPRTDPKKLPGHPGMREECPVHCTQARAVDTRRRLVCERCLEAGWCDEGAWGRGDLAFVPYFIPQAPRFKDDLFVIQVRISFANFKGFAGGVIEVTHKDWLRAGNSAGYLRAYSLCRTEEEAWGRIKQAQELGGNMEKDLGFLGKHIPPKEEPATPAVPELTSEARIDHSHDLDGCGWTNFKLMQTHEKLEVAKNALKKIASCKSTIEGDVVDIAQKALKGIEQWTGNLSEKPCTK